jgi:hypothetical protein
MSEKISIDSVKPDKVYRVRCGLGEFKLLVTKVWPLEGVLGTVANDNNNSWYTSLRHGTKVKVRFCNAVFYRAY